MRSVSGLHFSTRLSIHYHLIIVSQSTSLLATPSRHIPYTYTDVVYVRPRRCLWLCALRSCRRTAIELSRLPPLEFGTVCHITSRLHNHCLVFHSRLKTHLFRQFSLIILSCPRSDTRYYGHVNRCFYLLTFALKTEVSHTTPPRHRHIHVRIVPTATTCLGWLTGRSLWNKIPAALRSVA